jgi:transcription elongation factor GreB
VFFGAWVTLTSQYGEEVTYRIVGADEFDPKRNWISVDSPLARALLKRRVDEEFEVRTPNGPRVHCVRAVSYDIDRN